MYFKLQKFTSQNLVNQAAVFCVRNALKVIYEHLRFENFSRGLYPRTPLKGEGGHGEGRKGVVPLRFNLVPHRFLWTSYGPDCMSALRMCVCAYVRLQHFIRQFTLCCMSIFTTLATSVHSNGGTYIFCAKVTEVIFEIIDRRRAPH